MRPIYIYRLAVQTEHDSEELDTEEVERVIRNELTHNNYLNIVGIEWLEIIDIDKSDILKKGKK